MKTSSLEFFYFEQGSGEERRNDVVVVRSGQVAEILPIEPYTGSNLKPPMQIGMAWDEGLTSWEDRSQKHSCGTSCPERHMHWYEAVSEDGIYWDCSSSPAVDHEMFLGDLLEMERDTAIRFLDLLREAYPSLLVEGKA